MSTPLLTRKELARQLHISLDGLDKLVHHPRNPLPRYRAGRRFLFKLDEVLAHIRVDPPKVKRGRRVGT